MKGFLGGKLWKTTNPHSLEHLKFLHNVLCKHQTVTEQNRALLVETLRSISEILIWGDQNDSTVFDFFLEKNMLSFFLRFMKQKSGRFIIVQLLQTLNILFENISNQTSIYYLLSNNHINSIIVHKFDFSDEEVMAYYISFLKTLSLRLNKHTIHFFYNENTNDFPLYTEAIKFFNQSESMVRIAVRTITLNVYKAIDDRSMLRYIRDKTATPYFSNLVWFIGNHVLELDACVRHDIDHNSRDRLADLVAEHLDHLHYVNDILGLRIDSLNEVLTDHLLNNLLLPLYVYSIRRRYKIQVFDSRPHIATVVALFLLSQVFLIIHHPPLVRQLADVIFNADLTIFSEQPAAQLPQRKRRHICEFAKPSESLANTLDKNRGSQTPQKRPNYRNSPELQGGEEGESIGDEDGLAEEATGDSELSLEQEDLPGTSSDVANAEVGVESGNNASGFEDMPSPSSAAADTVPPYCRNVTDDEKWASQLTGQGTDENQVFSLENRPFLDAVFKSLHPKKDDHKVLLALCLLYAICHNKGINQELLDSIQLTTDKSTDKSRYNVTLVEALIKVISSSCQSSSKIRLASLDLGIKLLLTLVYAPGRCDLQDQHLAAVEDSREEATLMLRNFYKSEEIFLDMFEDEYREMKNRPLNVEFMMMDASVLLPPTGTPLTGIDFMKRLPCGEVERARRAIRVLFYLRYLSYTLLNQQEGQLPLTKEEECIKVDDVLDLNNSDLIACTITTKDNKRDRRFLVIDILQLILVEPDNRKLGWGIVKFVGLLQDAEVSGDKEDSRCLHITIHKPSVSAHVRPTPLLAAKFAFDDHIRCMAARQRLTKGRLRARQRKMQMIARLLELPAQIVDAMYQGAGTTAGASPTTSSRTGSSSAIPGRSHQITGFKPHPGGPLHSMLKPKPSPVPDESIHKSIFSSVEQSRAFAAAEAQNKDATGKTMMAKHRQKLGKTSVEQAVEVQADTGQSRAPDWLEPRSGYTVDSEGIALEDLTKKARALVSGTKGLFRGKREEEQAVEEGDEAETTIEIDEPTEQPMIVDDSETEHGFELDTAGTPSSPDSGNSPTLSRKVLGPATLTLASTPRVSLVESSSQPSGVVAVSPMLLPPTEPGLIRRLREENIDTENPCKGPCQVDQVNVNDIGSTAVPTAVADINEDRGVVAGLSGTSLLETLQFESSQSNVGMTHSDTQEENSTAMEPLEGEHEDTREGHRQWMLEQVADSRTGESPPFSTYSKTPPSMEPSSDVAEPILP